MPQSRDPEKTLAAARLIRGYLRDLLPGDDAEAFDSIIAQVLNFETADPITAAQRVEAVLTSRASTEAWFFRVLQDEQLRPPEQQAWELRGIEPISGQLPIPALKYACPFGDYVIVLRSIGQRRGTCPTHNVDLVQT